MRFPLLSTNFNTSPPPTCRHNLSTPEDQDTSTTYPANRSKSSPTLTPSSRSHKKSSEEEIPDPARCPFTNPLGIFYQGQPISFEHHPGSEGQENGQGNDKGGHFAFKRWCDRSESEKKKIRQELKDMPSLPSTREKVQTVIVANEMGFAGHAPGTTGQDGWAGGCPVFHGAGMGNDGKDDKKLDSGMGTKEKKQGVEGVAASVVDAVDLLGKTVKDSEGKDSLYALNTLLEASYAQGYTDRNLFSPPYQTSHSSNFHSVLPLSMIDFASKYPLITVASLGALGTVVLLSTGAITAKVFKSLAGGNRKKPFGLDVRLDDLERRLANEVTKSGLSRKGELDSLKQEIIKLRALLPLSGTNANTNSAFSGMSMKGPSQGQGLSTGIAGLGSSSTLQNPISKDGVTHQNKLDGKAFKAAKAAMSNSAPIAPGIEEVRLKQVIREVLEDVMNTYKAGGAVVKSSSSSEEELQAVNDKFEEVMDAVDRLEVMSLDIMEEIKLLKESNPTIPGSAAESNPTTSTPSEAGTEEVMSPGDIKKAIKTIQDEYIKTHSKGSSTSTAREDELVDVGKVADELETGFIVKEHPKDTQAEIMEENLSRAAETALPRNLYSYDLGKRGDEAVIVDELVKNKDKAKSPSVSDAQPAEPSLETSAKKQPHAFYQTAQAPPKHPAVENAIPLFPPTPPPMSGFVSPTSTSASSFSSASSSSPSATATSSAQSSSAPPLSARKPTPLPKSAPMTPSSSHMSQYQALYGVDDSGDWSFTLSDLAPDKGWHEVPIVLSKRKEEKRNTSGLFWRGFSQSSSSVSYSAKARIFFYPEANMLELDGIVWGCGREGGRHVIRSKISG